MAEDQLRAKAKGRQCDLREPGANLLYAITDEDEDLLHTGSLEAFEGPGEQRRVEEGKETLRARERKRRTRRYDQ
jgi:hypothetical protein